MLMCAQPDPAQAIADDIARMHNRMRQVGASRVYVLAVTDEGVRYADVDGARNYKRLVALWGHQIVGYYNARVDRNHILADALDAAREIGLL